MNFTMWINLITPVMMTVLGFLVWRYRHTWQRRATKEEYLNEELFRLYDTILQPYLLIMGSDQVWKANKKYKGKNKEEVAKSLILEPGYQKAMLKLTLIAPDYVVRTLNDFIVHSRKMEEQPERTPENTTESIRKLGELLLAIRKGCGHDNTRLRDLDMLKWIIRDLEDQIPPGSKLNWYRSCFHRT